MLYLLLASKVTNYTFEKISVTGISQDSRMQSERPKAYFTDGEGPVVLKDLARDISVKRLRPNMFDTVSMWVAHESQKTASSFKPGDTLGVIIPHLLLHGVTDDDLREEALNTQITSGAIEHLATLRRDGWNIRVISTAYSALWETVCQKIGIKPEEIASTQLNLANLRADYFTETIAQEVHLTQEDIADFSAEITSACEQFKSGMSLQDVFNEPNMDKVSNALSELHLIRLPKLGFPVLKLNPVLNSQKKVEAMNIFASELGVSMADVIYVGDSITDQGAIKSVSEAGGLAIAFNGDVFAIINAHVAVASSDARSIKPLVDAWVVGGRESVKKYVEGQFVSSKERINIHPDNRAHYALVTADSIKNTVDTHKDARTKARGLSTPII